MTRLDTVGAKLVSLAIIVFGLYIIWEGSGMNIGQLRRIGPGFFPIVLGIVIALLGVATLFEASERRLDEAFGLRPLIFVSLGLLSFALLVRNAGLFPATLALVVLSSLGQKRIDIKAMVVTILALWAIGYAIFIMGLGLPVRVVAG